MSQNLSDEDVLFRQRFLSCCGFYTDTLDGLWGQHTDDAEKAFAARAKAIADAEGRFDSRSEQNIQSLRTDAQAAARQSLKAIRTAGFDARIISGTRTYPEQAALFKQGRFGNPGAIVTKARAGQSWHNFGLAWDIGLFQGGAYLKNDGPYITCGPHGKVTGVEWGGDWPGNFQDNPHYQFGTRGIAISVARANFEGGGR
jgi:peptidoglycan L-alanyl-D-glutamate endopeptidase CwlK